MVLSRGGGSCWSETRAVETHAHNLRDGRRRKALKWTGSRHQLAAGVRAFHGVKMRLMVRIPRGLRRVTPAERWANNAGPLN